MPKEVLSEARDDTMQVEEGLKEWKNMTDDIIIGLSEPTRNFQKKFEASIKGEWEAAKKKLEKASLGTSSQDKLVSIQIYNRLCFNSRFRESSPAGWSIDAMLIPISTSWRNALLPFKHSTLT